MEHKYKRIEVGLDIGTTKVAAVVGGITENGEVDILGIGDAPSDGVRRGTIYHIDKTVRAIRKAIDEASAHSNMEIYSVFVGVTGEHLKSTQQKGIITLSNPEEEITEQDVARLRNDMYRIATPPGSEIVHVIPQDYTVDEKTAIKDPVGMNGVRLEGNFHIVTGEEHHIKMLYRTVEKAGLEVAGLVLQSLASSYAVIDEEEKEAGVVLVDIGGGTTDVAVWKNGYILDTAIVPFGGDIITRDIMAGCQIMQKHAEALKQQYGYAMASELKEEHILSIPGINGRPPKEIHQRTLSRIIQARMEEIAEMATVQIEKAGLQTSEVYGGILLTGAGAQMPYAADLMEYVSGFDTRIAAPSTHLSRGLVEELGLPKYSTAAGLMLWGLFEDEGLPVDGKNKSRTGLKRPAESSKFVGMMKGWFEKTISNANAPIE